MMETVTNYFISDILPVNSFVVGSFGDKNMYTVRVNIDEVAKTIVDGSFDEKIIAPIGTYIDRDETAYFPYKKTYIKGTSFEVLTLIPVSRNLPTKEKISQMVNASYVAYNNTNYNGYIENSSIVKSSIHFFCSALLPTETNSSTGTAFNITSVGTDNENSNNYINAGYVAKDSFGNVIVGFRGTQGNIYDWFNNFLTGQTSKKVKKKGKSYNFHAGFYYATDSILSNIISQVKSNLKGNKTANIYVTGHSKGGAMAAIAALYLKKTFSKNTIEVFTFGAPKIGDANLMNYYNSKLLNSFNYICESDPVPLTPLTQGFKTTFNNLTSNQITKFLLPPLANNLKGLLFNETGKNAISEKELNEFNTFLSSITEKISEIHSTSSANTKIKEALIILEQNKSDWTTSFTNLFISGSTSENSSKIGFLAYCVLLNLVPKLKELASEKVTSEKIIYKNFINDTLPKLDDFINAIQNLVGNVISDSYSFVGTMQHFYTDESNVQTFLLEYNGCVYLQELLKQVLKPIKSNPKKWASGLSGFADDHGEYVAELSLKNTNTQ